MPFVQVDISKEIEKEKVKSPEFKKVWDEYRKKYKLVDEMINISKQKKMTQNK